MPATINNGDGTTPDIELAEPPTIWVSGAPHPLVEMYAMIKTQVAEDPPTFEEEWVLIESWVVPTELVPGLDIAPGGQETPPNVRVFWTSITNPGDFRHDYDVRVEWFRNGVLFDSVVVGQSAGEVFEEFTSDDDVYAEVAYVNINGTGPESTTDTLSL